MDVIDNLQRDTNRVFAFCVVTVLSFSSLLFPLDANAKADDRIVMAMEKFSTVLNFARREAIRKGVRVVICPTRNGKQCASSSQWHNGVMLFADIDGDRKRDKREPILHLYRLPVKRIATYSSGSAKWVIYQPSGATPGTKMTLTFCDLQGAARPKAILLGNTGRIRVSNKRINGKPLSCRP